ncbi:MAG TPA: polyketide cyclase [Bdellovibrionales bacterium]|nr:polyketide cyclase [Pseudobdellovibrionaceae bacterium]HAG91011.1 polyketide cyclase [Bdellovibrionales bacterium]|tara:strand:+ start:2832 stop:3266 length:435 start_codon:yes stop_codon:yes gene_type:complete
MAAASTTEIFDCTPEQFYKIISDYENYPKFLDEVSDCKIVEDKGEVKKVEFKVSLIKTFSYTLKLQEEPNKKVEWSLDSGDVFKTSNGKWLLEEAPGGKTKAHYEVDATFKIFVPGPVAKALVNVNLPNMMKSYKKRVSELYGR